MARDLYRVLGVAEDASPESIRRAYRRLARSIHPDAAGKHADAARFREIHDAYAVLSDPERRSLYDRSRSGPPRTYFGRREAESLRSRETFVREGLRPRVAAPDGPMSRLWRGFLGDTPFGFDIGVRRFHLNVVLDPEEARFGCRVPFEVPVRTACPRCRGSGEDGLWDCVECGGSGALVTGVPLALHIEPGIVGLERHEISLGKMGRQEIVLAVTVSVR